MSITLDVLFQLGLLLLALTGLAAWYWYQYSLARRENSTCDLHDCHAGTKNTEHEESTMLEDKPNASQNGRHRLRDLGITIGVLPTGANNNITDVPGVLVGQTTVNHGEGATAARTGVTVIKPHSGNLWNDKVSAGAFVLNGNGCVTGLDWIRESGLLEGPIALTATHSVGDVYKALIRWMIAANPQIGRDDDSYLPVVGECDDSALNDSHGFHVQEQHVMQALDSASAGVVAEGAVGAGTGMSCYDFKGGIGSASRQIAVDGTTYTTGVLVNCNHGDREQLLVAGVPVGAKLEAEMASMHREGSICIIVATDAPLSARQLERISKRAALGLARTGATANQSSGDFVLSFSTTRTVSRTDDSAVLSLAELNDDHIDGLFKATVEATEEAILNALSMAATTVGRDGNVSPALPLDRLVELVKNHHS
jgi:D-aminopeptidase